MFIVKFKSQPNWFNIEDLKLPWLFTFGDHDFFFKIIYFVLETSYFYETRTLYLHSTVLFFSDQDVFFTYSELTNFMRDAHNIVSS